jgi:hypothetical protein
MADDNKGHGHNIHYTVDGEPESTREEKLTPVQIMKNAGIDPQTHYLEQVKGHDIISYKDAPNEPIEIKDGAKFLTKSIGPMPVS